MSKSPNAIVSYCMALIVFASVGFTAGYCAPCAVRCTSTTCWKGATPSNKCYKYTVGTCNWWFVAMVGCTPDECTAVGTANVSYREAASCMPDCDPIETNAATAPTPSCGTLIGDTYNGTCKAGCQAK